MMTWLRLLSICVCPVVIEIGALYGFQKHYSYFLVSKVMFKTCSNVYPAYFKRLTCFFLFSFIVSV